ncbi:MAG: hypothetical protein KC636_37525, partial [Myxococcales bacterium]|nr:hypothetical protein [Myxococcales bacterium]
MRSLARVVVCGPQLRVAPALEGVTARRGRLGALLVSLALLGATACKPAQPPASPEAPAAATQ